MHDAADACRRALHLVGRCQRVSNKKGEKLGQEQLPGPLTELEACLQTDVTWRATNAFLRGATGSAWSGKFRPLARELLPRLLFIIHAALYRLIDGEPGSRRNVEFATAGNIELRHLVGYGNDQLRIQNYHRD
jgi:hypothetical protein